MTSPWWLYDRSIDLDDKLNIVQMVKTKEPWLLTKDTDKTVNNHPKVHNNKLESNISTTNNDRTVQSTSPASLSMNSSSSLSPKQTNNSIPLPTLLSSPIVNKSIEDKTIN